MGDWANALQSIVAVISANSSFAFSVIGLLFIITVINRILHGRLAVLGIYPRHPIGLIGIFFSPFIHMSFEHFLFNSIPLFVLICLALINGYQTFYIVTVAIIMLSGLLIWLLGRRALHCGASSLIMGYFGYLLAQSYFEHTKITIVLAIIVIYYFGSLFLSIFPTEERVSWEGHLFGFVSGIAVSFLYPHLFALLLQYNLVSFGG